MIARLIVAALLVLGCLPMAHADAKVTSSLSACGYGSGDAIYEKSVGALSARCVASWPGNEANNIVRTTMTITGCAANSNTTISGSGDSQMRTEYFLCTKTQYKTQNGGPVQAAYGGGWNPDTAGVYFTSETCVSANSHHNFWTTGGGGCSPGAPNPCADTTTVVATGGLTSASAASPTCVSGCSVAAVSGTNGDLGISITFDNGTKVSGLGSQATQWKRTGSICTGDGLGAAEATATKFGTTASVGGNRAGGCGTFNGEYYCAGTSPPPAGGCVTTAGGQAFCSTAAVAPPAPKNPATGSTATPDAVVATTGPGGSQTTNYYNSTTVVNGTTGGATGGSTGGTSSGTSGGSTGGTTGTTTSGETTGGAGYTEPTLGDAMTFGDAGGVFLSTATNSPIGQAVGALSSVHIASGAACPTYQFDLPIFGRSYTMDSHCGMLENIRPILSAVMLLFFLIIGYRILASA